MRTYNVLIIASLLSVFSSASQAEGSLYVGAAAGVSSYQYPDIDPAAATKLFVGYNIDEKISLEVTAFDSGDADITSFPGTTLNSNGINVTAFYRLPSSVNNLTAMVGGGIYSFDTTLDVFGFTTSESGSGLSLAIGLELALTKYFALRAGIDAFVGVKDLADNRTMNSFNVGLVLNF